jgi:glycosyltransferase involved in cell wall biosynthesis
LAVAFDLQAIQTRGHAERGIARYTRELATALDTHHPGVIDAFILNPDLPVPHDVERFRSPVVLRDEADPAAFDIWHVASPFEGAPLDDVWPPAARRSGARLVVTLYDVIPALFPHDYLATPTDARHYFARLELIRRADRVLTISNATAADAVRHAGIRANRISVIGAGTSPIFRPPADPAIRDGYVLYTGGVDPRKNLARLLDAYAATPPELRRDHSLVVVCAMSEPFASGFADQAERLGITDDVRFTGRVSDDELVALYQAASLFVFPSRYEGYGLPVAEARACGTPVIAAANSSITELLSAEEACFDADDTASITTALETALGDPARLARLRALPSRSRRWEDVAAATAAAYRQVQRRGRRPAPHQSRIAYVSPIPPCESGIAIYSLHLVDALRALCAVDVFFDGPGDPAVLPAGVRGHHIEFFEQIESIRGGYDRIVYCIGNQTYHASALSLLRFRPGIVVAHDVRLTGLYAWCAQFRPDLVPDGFAVALYGMYEGRIPPGLGGAGSIDHTDADNYGIFMARDVIHLATRYYAHSRVAARWATLDAAPEDRHKVGVLPFAIAGRIPPLAPSMSTDRPLIASFGVVDPIKRSPMILEAFKLVAERIRGARLALVGALPEVVRQDYLRRARELGLADRIDVPGWVGDAEYDRLLREATVAVQLRASSGGESSAALGDCLSAGIPTIASDIGFVRDLPDRCVAKVPAAIDDEQLSRVISDLLADEPRREQLAEESSAYAADHSFACVAGALYEELRLPARA